MNDHFIKFLFANPDNKHLTIALINSVFDFFKLEERVKDIKFKDRETYAAQYKDKTCTVDVLVEDKQANIYNIEFQVKTFIGFIDRIIFYWSKHFIKLRRGDDYDKLKRMTSIVFSQFKFFKDQDKRYARSFHIVDDDIPDLKLSDKLHIVVIDVPKWNKNKPSIDKMTLLDMFIAFFSKSTKYETLEELSRKNKIMEQLFKAQDVYRQSDAFVAGYRTAEDLERDSRSHDKSVKKNAIQKVVKRMLKKNMQIDEIAYLTEFTKEEILEIKEQLKSKKNYNKI